MASLENKKIKDTYQGLLKTDDNAAIDGAVEITDGAGNGTGVTISNDGQVTATGTVSFGSLKDTGEDITVTKFVDEADGIGNNDNDTSVPTSAAVKDYVDTNVTAQDLDFQGDSGSGAVDLDSQSLDIAGGTGIDTSAVDQTLTVNIDSTVATLTGTQTLTNKSIDLTDNTLSGTTAEFNTALSDDDFATLAGTETLTNKTVDADNNTVSNLEVDNLKSGVLDTDLTSVSASDDTLASAKAIKTYVDSNITAQDLDITDGTTSSAVDLDSQTLSIEGTANEVEVSLTDQTFTVGLPTSITTNVTGNLTGNVTGNVTGDVTGNADTASALETARTISLSGDVAGSVSFDGSANADITATIQANSVALGTDTTGDYVSGLGTGTGVTIGSNTGEGSSPTISVDYGSTANTAVQGNTSLTIQGTANEIEVTGGGVTLGSGGTVTVGLPDDVSLGGSLTIAQNLTVNGTTTTVNTDTLSVEDPLIELARDNSENSVDVGLYGKYSLDSGVTTKYSGLFKDASDSDKFKLFKGLEVEPTSTVDTSGTGYTKGDLVINDLDAVTISGTISTAAQTNITSVGTLSSLSVSGDLTVDTNTLYVDSSNNRVGIGTSSPTVNLDIRGGSQAMFFGSTDGVNLGQVVANASGTTFGSRTNDPVRFTVNNTERMRIDSSGNVGIGTSSPSGGKLHIYATNTPTKFESSTTTLYNTYTNSNGNFGFLGTGSGVASGGSANDFGIQAVNNFVFATGGSTERLRIDSSGVVTIKNDLLLDNGVGRFTFQNASGVNDVYSTTTGFGAYEDLRISADNYIFRTGTTERLRIDSSGNVGIGTSSPQSVLHSSAPKPTYTDSGVVFRGGTTNSDTHSGISLMSAGNALTGSIGSNYLVDNTTISQTNTGRSSGYIQFNNTTASSVTSDISFGGLVKGTSTQVERMRITSGGQIGVGISSPTSNGGATAKVLHIHNPNTAEWAVTHYTNGSTGTAGSDGLLVGNIGSDGYLFNYENANLIFGTNTNERMRITGGGDIWIGRDNDAFTDTGYVFFESGTSYQIVDGGACQLLKRKTTNGEIVRFYKDTSQVGNISVTGTATAYNTSSDYRLKENVVDLTGALDRVDQLEPKRFNFIADEDTTVDGFLAHEVQDIVPEAVTGDKDATEEYEVSPEVLDDEGNVVEEAVMGTRDVYQGIDQSKLVPLLVGAIKELRAEVNSLKAQINN